jgi:pRiA4b ORF-3-like protein
MSRHLASCAARALWDPVRGPRGKKTRLFHLQIQGRDRPEYWMHLEARADRTLAEIDFYLRQVWLECCGHLSQFTIANERYIVSPSPFNFDDEAERDMNVPLKDVLEPGLRFSYEYDFGTPTELSLRVLGEREDLPHNEFAQVLARNDAPEISCELCGERAVQVCAVCSQEDRGWLCAEHAAAHSCGKEALLPVVNSPRVGVCGYTGV